MAAALKTGGLAIIGVLHLSYHAHIAFPALSLVIRHGQYCLIALLEDSDNGYVPSLNSFWNLSTSQINSWAALVHCSRWVLTLSHCRDYRLSDGMNVPHYMEADWNLMSGDCRYAKLQVVKHECVLDRHTSVDSRPRRISLGQRFC